MNSRDLRARGFHDFTPPTSAAHGINDHVQTLLFCENSFDELLHRSIIGDIHFVSLE